MEYQSQGLVEFENREEQDKMDNKNTECNCIKDN